MIGETPDLVETAVAGKGDAETALEAAGQVEGAVEAALIGHLLDCSPVTAEQTCRPLEAGLDQPSLWRQAGVGFEQTGEVIGIEAAGGCPGGDGDILVEPLPYPFLRREHFVDRLWAAFRRPPTSGRSASCNSPNQRRIAAVTCKSRHSLRESRASSVS